MGLTPIDVTYETEPKVRREFQNLYDNVQPKQFMILSSTPSPDSLREGQVVIVATTTLHLMLKQGTTIWFVKFSSK